MAEYHVGAGAFGIYAGTLEPRKMYAEGLQYKAEKNEQWKKEGKCSICRRVNYCKEDCTARKRNIMGVISNRFRRMVGADTLQALLKNEEVGL